MSITSKDSLSNPILLIGGSGIVGRWTARFLREKYPQVPLLIGGRNEAKAQEMAAEIGYAEGVKIDLTAEDLNLGDRPISAVAIFFTDDRTAVLRFAQSRGVPYLSISPAINEIGPDLAAFIQAPGAAPVVLGTEWLVGATTIPALEFAKEFKRVEDITIGALLDEEDSGGPAAYADLERQTKTLPSALIRREGVFKWCTGEEVTSRLYAVDGREMEATRLTINDVVALATETRAPNVQFNLAIGETSTRRQGKPMSTEIMIELSGESHEGQPLRTRHAVVHPQGQMPLTGFGVAMLLERLTGLDGQPATPAGLYFPYQLLESETYLTRLKQMGGTILKLEI